jgi:hypothetical protein
MEKKIIKLDDGQLLPTVTKKIIKLDDGQLLPTVTNKRQTRPLVSEGAQQRQRQQNSDRINIWSQVPKWSRRQDLLTD